MGSMLQQQVENGGSAVRNTELFYEAAMLASIMEWWGPLGDGFNGAVEQQGLLIPFKDWMDDYE